MAILPDGLGLLISWAIKFSFLGDLAHSWTTTGEVLKGTEWDYTDAAALIDGLGLALRELVYEPIYIHGGTARRYVPRTIEPNPDPPVYNGTNHVAYNGLHIGVRTLGDEMMFYDQVWDVHRLPEFGNIGRLEIRGALREDAVTESLLTKVLTTPGDYTSLALAFNETLGDLAITLGADFVMCGEPLVSTVRTTVDNVNHEVRTYGETQVKPIFSFTSGGIRTDKGKSAWFNSQRVGG